MCLFPINAELPPEGGRPLLDKEGSLRLPCGKCHECIKKRAVEWASRARYEISEHTENSFLTLTYNPENLPSHFIIKTDFQKFIKRLRKKLHQKIRYMVSYEYGTKNFRPHMHAILFGYNPKEQKFLKSTPSGNNLFTSSEISSLWDKGFHSIGTANEKTAYYIASYALKGKKKEISHPDTGETIEIADCMNVSNRPAIGLNYFIKNNEQMVESKELLPRYYLKKMEQHIEALEAEKPTKSQKKLIKLFQNVDSVNLIEKYQNKQLLNFNNRSDREKYAKFTIDSQQINLSTSNFREHLPSDSEIRQHEGFKRRLKQDRDNYVAHNKGKKNA